MTKLTQQEIEKEREMFIKFNVKCFADSILYQYDHEGDEFITPFINARFQGWLARAELAKGGE